MAGFQLLKIPLSESRTINCPEMSVLSPYSSVFEMLTLVQKSSKMGLSKKVAFFIPEAVQLLDLTGPIQVFYESNCYGAQFELLYFSMGKRIINISSAGLSIAAVADYSNINLHSGDYLFLPGAEMDYLRSQEFKSQKDFFAWLVKNYESGVKICTICTGAFILAATGLLDFKSCTTHWKRIKELQELYPSLNILRDVLYTQDGSLYTSAGITSGIDLALAIVEDNYGALFVNKVSRELLVYYRGSGSHTQQNVYLNYRNHIHSGIHRVQDWLIENLEKKFTIPQLAFLANMGERNLTRVFKKATGLTIHQYTTALRLEKLKTLQFITDFKNEELASKLGYSNSRQLIRIKNKFLK